MANQEKHTDSTFQRIVEASPIALLLVNKVGKIEYANAFTETLFLYSKEELSQAPLEMLIPKRFASKHNEYLQHYFRKPDTRQMGKGRDLFAIKKNGEEFPVEIGLNPIEAGKELLILAVVIDISDRKEAEQLLQKRSKQLEFKNNELEQFNTIASHDLQEPLNTIISWTDLLQHHFEAHQDGKSVRMFGFITNAATRMKNLIRGLLEHSRIGKNSEISEVNCTQLLKSIQEDLQASINQSGAKMVVNQLPSIWAYKLEMRLLFQNLISNAIKYRKDGVIPQISISSKKINDAWQFTVKDNGIGIDKKHHKKIFGIFHRIQPIDSIKGTGIGLAHCKKIIDLHQGSISVDSAPGEGSAFIFTIPKLQHDHK